MYMEKITWRTEKRRVRDLIPFEYNPRKLTKKQYEDLKKSLQKFDLADIPVINLDNTIIGGHQRIKILADLGRLDDEIEVRVPNRMLTDEELRELNLRLNKNIGEWDFDLLANFDEGLLLEVGFETAELDRIFDIKLGEEEDFEEETALAKAQQNTRCKVGELWQLGEHRLYIGDATEEESIQKVLQGKKVEMVLTDPPYDFDLEKLYTNFELIRKVADKAFYFCDDKMGVLLAYKYYNYFVRFFVYYYEPGLLITNTRPILKHDLIASFFFKGERGLRNHHKAFGTVLPAPVKRRNKEAKQLGIKEAKSPETCVLLIEHYTDRGDIILDCFAGSGTTAIACELTGRKARLIELDPVRGEVILARWESFTGGKAEKIEG